MVIITFILGLIFLIVGAELLVRGASKVALATGISHLLVGLTIVAWGTSTPEMMVSLTAAVRGNTEIALGNTVGSNIFNLLYILGATGLIQEGGIEISYIARLYDIPLMIFTAIICMYFGFTKRTIERWEGLTLFVFYLIYIVLIATKSNIHISLSLDRFF